MTVGKRLHALLLIGFIGAVCLMGGALGAEGRWSLKKNQKSDYVCDHLEKKFREYINIQFKDLITKIAIDIVVPTALGKEKEGCAETETRDKCVEKCENKHKCNAVQRCREHGAVNIAGNIRKHEHCLIKQSTCKRKCVIGQLKCFDGEKRLDEIRPLKSLKCDLTPAISEMKSTFGEHLLTRSLDTIFVQEVRNQECVIRRACKLLKTPMQKDACNTTCGRWTKNNAYTESELDWKKKSSRFQRCHEWKLLHMGTSHGKYKFHQPPMFCPKNTVAPLGNYKKRNIKGSTLKKWVTKCMKWKQMDHAARVEWKKRYTALDDWEKKKNFLTETPFESPTDGRPTPMSDGHYTCDATLAPAFFLPPPNKFGEHLFPFPNVKGEIESSEGWLLPDATPGIGHPAPTRWTFRST